MHQHTIRRLKFVLWYVCSKRCHCTLFHVVHKFVERACIFIRGEVTINEVDTIIFNSITLTWTKCPAVAWADEDAVAIQALDLGESDRVCAQARLKHPDLNNSLPNFSIDVARVRRDYQELSTPLHHAPVLVVAVRDLRPFDFTTVDTRNDDEAAAVVIGGGGGEEHEGKEVCGELAATEHIELPLAEDYIGELGDTAAGAHAP